MEVPQRLCQSATILPITKADDSWTDSLKESLNLLLDTHFSGSELADTCSNARVKHDVITDKMFAPEKVSWAINSFKPFKTQGPDGIQPIIIQKAELFISNQLIWLYKSYIGSHIHPLSQ